MKIFNWLKRKKQIELPILRTSEVFKVSGVPPHTFVERKSLSAKIEGFFDSKDSVLLFLGYSKSGKTVYRKKHLEKADFNIITFRCNNESTIKQLYEQIASEANLGQIISSQDQSGKKSAVKGSSTFGVKDVTSATLEVTDEVNYSYVFTEEKTKVKVDVNFLCNRLRDARILVILEDYHLVSSGFNKTLSEDLKHFLDDEILFVLLGIPSSPNRTLRNNPDLAGRLEHLIFDYLTIDEIKEIINSGISKLNVFFSEDVINTIARYSMSNAFLVQYICKVLLTHAGVNETQRIQKRIDSKALVKEACVEIAAKLNNDYRDIYSVINAGIRKQQDTKAFNQYEEILKVLKETNIEELEKGIHYTDIYKIAWEKFPLDIVQGFIDNETYKDELSFKNSFRTQIKQAVQNINLSLEKNTSRPVLFVDDGKIYLTDLIFKFYINWEKSA